MVQPEMVTFGETMGLIMPVGSRGIEYAPQFQKSFGGAESNVAIGVARMGHAAGWFGRLGDDPFGRLIQKALRGEGVDVSRAELTGEAPTGLMLRETVSGQTSVYYYRKYSAAACMTPAHLDEDYIRQARILHLTGITPALSDSCRETAETAVRIAKKHGVKVCFDPNLRLKLWPLDKARKVLLRLAEQADYFLPGLDELQLLYDTENFDTIRERLRELSAVSIVKGAGKETLVCDGGDTVSVPYFPVDHVVDTVGAGDGFCAGFISGLLKGYDYVESVRLGNLLGSMVIRMEGDWEALPDWKQVRAVLDNKKHIER